MHLPSYSLAFTSNPWELLRGLTPLRRAPSATNPLTLPPSPLPLQVTLTVQARTSFAVWGEVPPDGVCCPNNHPSCTPPPSLSVGLGPSLSPTFVDFTACDADHLPVMHQLPDRRDHRRFVAHLRGVSQRVRYVGEGAYSIDLLLEEHGPFSLDLELGELVYSRDGLGVCREGMVELSSGVCGCPSDHEPGKEGGCVTCAQGKYKPLVGNSKCISRPLEV